MIVIATEALHQRHPQMVGELDVRRIGNKIAYKGIEYTYKASGFCREVYVSPDKTHVIKVPKCGWGFCNGIPHDLPYPNPDESRETAIDHNIYEAEIYEQASDYHKSLLPKTEILETGWIKQEYCEVLRGSYLFGFGSTAEYGLRCSDGQATILDFDFMFTTAMDKPKRGWDYNRLERTIKNIINSHSKIG